MRPLAGDQHAPDCGMKWICGSIAESTSGDTVRTFTGNPCCPELERLTKHHQFLSVAGQSMNYDCHPDRAISPVLTRVCSHPRPTGRLLLAVLSRVVVLSMRMRAFALENPAGESCARSCVRDSQQLELVADITHTDRLTCTGCLITCARPCAVSLCTRKRACVHACMCMYGSYAHARQVGATRMRDNCPICWYRVCGLAQWRKWIRNSTTLVPTLASKRRCFHRQCKCGKCEPTRNDRSSSSKGR